MKRIIYIIQIIFLLIACDFDTVYSNMEKISNEIILTDKNNNSQIDISINTILTLKLEAIPGTGYSWHIMQNDAKCLKSLGVSYFEPMDDGKDDKILGARSYQTFRFIAQQKGTNVLLLHYKRDWEKKEPLKIFSITLQIYPSTNH